MVQRYRKPSRLGQIDSVGAFRSFPYSWLVVYYKLDETTGTVVNSSTGVYNWTNSNASINQTGKIWLSYGFNWSGSVVTEWSSYTAISNSSRSYACRVKLTSFVNYAWILLYDFNSNNVFVWIDTLGTTWNVRRVEWWWDSFWPAVNLGTWTWRHLWMTYDYTTWVVKTYVDWALSYTYNGTPWVVVPASILQLWRLETVYYMNWFIDEVWIWNRALTQDEITTLYNNWNWLTY